MTGEGWSTIVWASCPLHRLRLKIGSGGDEELAVAMFRARKLEMEQQDSNRLADLPMDR